MYKFSAELWTDEAMSYAEWANELRWSGVFVPGVHPSWAAKKSQSPAIGKFEGKKVKFD